jgi:hypothetical protein
VRGVFSEDLMTHVQPHARSGATVENECKLKSKPIFERHAKKEETIMAFVVFSQFP